MAHKRKGQLTVLGEWARHLRPVLHRAFWKGERQAERAQLAAEVAEAEVERRAGPAEKRGTDSGEDIGKGRVK